MFINREKEIIRIKQAFQRPKAQLIALYGRRRCGKSTLLRHLLDHSAIYFSADQSDIALQIASFSREMEKEIPGFSKPIYPDWETIFNSLKQSVKRRIVICFDEFPYLVTNDPSLPSVIQKWIDNDRERVIDLIICGSSQRMMYDLTLNGSAPLFGRCDEIIKITPMAAKYFKEYSGLNATDTINEFSVWGGVPRYWELRRNENDFESAVRKHILDPLGILYEEPERLFLDELRTATQYYSILELIGAGCHRISEIAGRLGKPASQLSRQISLLQELGYIKRMVPFGEDIRSSKKGIYKIEDDFLRFYYAYVIPNKSTLEFEMTDLVWNKIENELDMFTSHTWENICRQFISENGYNNIPFKQASSWWGTGLDGKTYEVDLVAESIDNTTLLIGEAKWSKKNEYQKWATELLQKIEFLPFIKGKNIIPILFVKSIIQVEQPTKISMIGPDEIMG
jgi:AAA+ ATPase superfamily predicted ATPase